MTPLGSRLFVAFDASSVSGGVLSFRLGRLKVHSFIRVPLPEGALKPTPFEANLVRPVDVQLALARFGEAVGMNGRGACLILPDGLARTLLLEVPRGVEGRKFARFRLGSSLPYPEDEAVVDGFAVGRGRFLASALRRSVIREYEELFARAGFIQERVDLAPMGTMCGILAHFHSGSRVDVILGDAAFSLAVLGDGELRVFRHRLRDPGPDEDQHLWDEVARTAAPLGAGEPRVRIVGPGAQSLAEALRRSGHRADAGWDVSLEGSVLEAAEVGWLGAALS